MVLIEAMAANTPIVASAIEGYQNVATDGVDSLLPEPGDTEALADAIRRVLDEPGLATRLVKAGAHRAEQYSMSTLASAYVALYGEVIRAHENEIQPPSTLRRILRTLVRLRVGLRTLWKSPIRRSRP